MGVREAIESMKIHHQWLPDRILYEKHLLSPDTKKILESMNHNLREVRRLGNLMGIEINRELGVYVGASDSSSKDGAAVGY